MQDVLFAGHRLRTSDAIATGIVELAAALTDAGRSTIIEFPVVIDNAVAQCRMVLTPSAPVVTVSLPGGAGRLPGETEALALLDRQRLALRPV